MMIQLFVLLIFILLVLIYIYAVWFREITFLIFFLKLKFKLHYFRLRNFSAVDVFQRQMQCNKHHTAILFEGKRFSYGEIEVESNKIANWANKIFRKNDCVALMMDNRPEFIITWLSLAKVGIRICLINVALRGDAIKSCVRSTDALCIIAGVEFSEVLKKEEFGIEIFFYAGSCANQLSKAENLLDESLQDSRNFVNKSGFSDILFYIFTSGTTGFPKAAPIRHSRFLLGGISFYYAHCLNSKDMYVNLFVFFKLLDYILVCLCFMLLVDVLQFQFVGLEVLLYI